MAFIRTSLVRVAAISAEKDLCVLATVIHNVQWATSVQQAQLLEAHSLVQMEHTAQRQVSLLMAPFVDWHHRVSVILALLGTTARMAIE